MDYELMKRLTYPVLLLCLSALPFAAQQHRVQQAFAGDGSSCNSSSLSCTLSTSTGVVKLSQAYTVGSVVVMFTMFEGTATWPTVGTITNLGNSSGVTWTHISAGNIVSCGSGSTNCSAITNGNYCQGQILDSSGHHFAGDCYYGIVSGSGVTGITVSITDSSGGSDLTNADLFQTEYSCNISPCSPTIDSQATQIYPGNGNTNGCTSACDSPSVTITGVNDIVQVLSIYEENCQNSGSTCPVTNYTNVAAQYDSTAQNAVGDRITSATAPTGVWTQTPKGGGIFSTLALNMGTPAYAVVPTGFCANNGDGSTWGCAASSGATGAFVGLPSTLIRGSIYYLADGDGTHNNVYGTSLSLGTADSGTETIELRKAQSFDHGPTSGWNTSTMGSGQAVWNNTTSGGAPFVNITTDYWTINGNGYNGGGTDLAIGCGGIQAGAGTAYAPTTAPPTPTGCGIKIDDSTCTNTATQGCDGGSGYIHGGANGITWKYVEWKGQGLNTNGNNNSETYGWWETSGTGNIVKHVYGHNNSTTYVTCAAGGCNNETYTMNYFWGLFDGSTNHGEAFQDTGTDSGVIVSYNYFRDQCNTTGSLGTNGDVVFVDPTTGTHNAWEIFGNVDFASSGDSNCVHHDGFIACINSSQTCTNFQVYQNTLIGITNNSGIVCTNSCSTWIMYNNLWYANPASAALVGTHDFNSFLNTSGPSETHSVNITSGAANPFVNWQAGDVQLSSDSSNVNSRTTTSLDPLTDLYGTAFTTDRGASQFSAATGASTMSGTLTFSGTVSVQIP
jgi:hypothetical protein